MSDSNTVEIKAELATAVRSDIERYFSGKFVDDVLKLPQDILALTEPELEKKFHPSTIDFLVRKNLHLKLKQARDSGVIEKLESREIYEGLCTKTNFYDRILVNQYKMAWLLIPIQAYEDLIEESFFHGLKKVREILDMPLTEKSAPHIMKALEFFTNRHLGPVIQRIEQKSMNVNFDGNKPGASSMSPDDIMVKYNELKSKLIDKPKDVVDLDAE